MRESPLRLSEEIRDQIISLEDRQERAELRRSAVPAALVLFLVVGYFFFGGRFFDGAMSAPTLAWTLTFGIGSLLGVVVNEITARRTLKRVAKEIELLRLPQPPEAFPR
jgi:hypothetical protein